MHLLRFRRRILGMLLGVLVTSSVVFATSIRPPSFEQLVDNSGRVVRATVVDIRPYEDSYNGERIVRTEVTLNVLESISGDVPLGELKIRHLGGQVGDLRLEVGAMPKYERGKELVLFLHGEGRFICPTVGWSHGKYFVDRTNPSVARIKRANGEFLRGLEQVSQPIHGGPPQTQAFDPLSQPNGITLPQFRQLVRQQFELNRQRHQE